MKELSVKGFQGTSLLDFPDRIAALLFTGGCNLSCPFCHNPGLVLDPGAYPDYPLTDLLDELQRRSNFIDGIVISGGEPTLDPGLPAFLRQIRALKLQIKLDSNGLIPEVIELLLAEELLDYLAIDLKTSPERYSELHHQPIASSKLLQSIELAKKADIEVEFRTTCVPQLVGHEEIVRLGEVIEDAPLWVLQQYVPQHAMRAEWQHLEAYPSEQLEDFQRQAQAYVGQVRLRGV